MKLSKPEDDPNQPVREEGDRDSSETSDGGVTEPTAEVDLGGEPEEMPVTEAVELHSEMLARPDAFGIARETDVDELQSWLEGVEGMALSHSDQIEELYDLLEELAYAEGHGVEFDHRHG